MDILRAYIGRVGRQKGRKVRKDGKRRGRKEAKVKQGGIVECRW